MKYALVIAGAVLVALPAQGAVRFVNANLAGGANTGSSWSDAFKGPLGLQAALAASQPGDQIWVAEGTYRATLSGTSPLVSFQLKDGVAVLGGFTGAQTLANQRNPATNTCILTGDALGNDVPNTFEGRQDNAYHVVRATGVSANTVLDGFTITAGQADFRPFGLSPDVSAGGGILCEAAASPTIRACRIFANQAGWSGAGLSIVGGTPLIEHCTFSGNHAAAGAGAAAGGGASVTFRNCSFVDHDANLNTVQGGGIAIGIGTSFSNPTTAQAVIEDCLFSIQMLPFLAGDGLGVSISKGHADIRRCRFINNIHGGSGGGVSCHSAATIDRCIFIGNEGQFDGGAAIYGLGGHVSISNSVFAGNDRGGFSTIMMQADRETNTQPGSVTLSNCTLFDNGTSSSIHRLLMASNSTISLRNCIVSGNKSSDGPAQALAQGFGPGVAFQFDSCDVEAWNGQFPGTSTFDTNPLFVNAAGPDGITGTADDNLRLLAGSQCIDRGSNPLAAPGGLDLDGLPRFRDDPDTPDLGIGPGPIVDLGAYEFAPPCTLPDITGDGTVNTADLTALLDVFGSVVPSGHPADLNHDGSIGIGDLVLLLAAFGLSCP